MKRWNKRNEEYIQRIKMENECESIKQPPAAAASTIIHHFTSAYMPAASTINHFVVSFVHVNAKQGRPCPAYFLAFAIGPNNCSN